jgi:hypothetical protein
VKVCSIEGCETGAAARGWCRKHYNRWQRHGDPNVTLIRGEFGEGYIARGYRMLYRPDHPLANCNGVVPEHRFVVYDAGIEIPPDHQVHHKNGDRLDNRLKNLEVLSRGEHNKKHKRFA